MFIDSITFVEKSVWGFADTMGVKGYELDPSMLSTFDTVTDAKAPILHKIFPGLRAMLQYVILQVEPPHPFCQTGSGISRPPTLSRLETATQKTPLTHYPQHANRPLPLPRLPLQTPNLHLLLRPPLLDLPPHRRRRLLLGRKIRRLALPRRREILLLGQSVAGLWIRRTPQRTGAAGGH